MMNNQGGVWKRGGMMEGLVGRSRARVFLHGLDVPSR